MNCIKYSKQSLFILPDNIIIVGLTLKNNIIKYLYIFFIFNLESICDITNRVNEENNNVKICSPSTFTYIEGTLNNTSFIFNHTALKK